MQSKLRTDTQKIIKLKEVLNVKCRSTFKNEIQMLFFFNNLISIDNKKSVQYFEIFTNIYCDC